MKRTKSKHISQCYFDQITFDINMYMVSYTFPNQNNWLIHLFRDNLIRVR